MMSIEEFKRDVYNLSTVNGKDINRLTEATKLHKDDAHFMVDIIVSSIKEVNLSFIYHFRAFLAISFQNFT